MCGQRLGVVPRPLAGELGMFAKIGAFAVGVSGIFAVGSVVMALVQNSTYVIFLIAAVALVALSRFMR